ncbi:MAG TPA: LysM domain-containing protein, partial [Myxococcaceae bacterium]
GAKKASGKFLARLIKYKVSDGETLESVADAHGLSADELAQFNWGTTDPKEIQKRLFLDVGCRETDSSGKFILTARDNPGILYIARPMELSLMASGPRQILRVAKVPGPPVFRFSA